MAYKQWLYNNKSIILPVIHSVLQILMVPFIGLTCRCLINVFFAEPVLSSKILNMQMYAVT